MEERPKKSFCLRFFKIVFFFENEENTKDMFRASLVLVFKNCFMFSKTRKIKRTSLFPNFFGLKNTKKKTLIPVNKNSFQKNTKMVFS